MKIRNKAWRWLVIMKFKLLLTKLRYHQLTYIIEVLDGKRRFNDFNFDGLYKHANKDKV